MLVGPDWNTLYAQGNCLYYGVPFSDEQWDKLNAAKTPVEREEIVRKFREEYMKNRDLATGELLKTAEVKKEEPKAEPEEDVKPAKTKKGK